MAIDISAKSVQQYRSDAEKAVDLIIYRFSILGVESLEERFKFSDESWRRINAALESVKTEIRCGRIVPAYCDFNENVVFLGGVKPCDHKSERC